MSPFTLPVSGRWRHPSVWAASSWLVLVQVAVVGVLTLVSVAAEVSGRLPSWWGLCLLPYGVAWVGERFVRAGERAARARGRELWREVLVREASRPPLVLPDSAELRVTLADVPTDVLVFLVDHGPSSAAKVFLTLVPSSVAEHLSGAVASALGLLREMGWIHWDIERQVYLATEAGVRAVVEARARQAASS